MDGQLLEKEVHRGRGGRYQGRQRGRDSAAGRTTRGDKAGDHQETEIMYSRPWKDRGGIDPDGREV